MSVTANLGITKVTQAQGSKEVTVNTALDTLDAAVAGVLSKSVAGASNVTLSPAEALNAVLTFTGVLTGNINVIVPTANKVWTIFNNTTGAFTLTVKTAAGTGIAVTQATYAILYCNGTNVLQAVVAAAAGGVALSAVTAAVATSTLQHAGYAQLWKWQFGGNNIVGLRLIESTGMPGFAGIVFEVDTDAGSASIPARFKSLGNEVCRISKNSTQLVLSSGTFAAPTLCWNSDPTGGLSYSATNGTSIVDAGVECCAFITTSALPGMRSHIPQASATGFFRDYRKSRGTQASPSAITSGDDMVTIGGQAYVGATGTFVRCAAIKFTTEGTIANTTTGVGGVIMFNTMNVGSAIAERGRWDSKGNFIIGTAALATTATDGFPYIPSGAGPPTGVPTTYTGRVPLYYDSTNDFLYLYRGGWKKSTVYA